MSLLNIWKELVIKNQKQKGFDYYDICPYFNLEFLISKVEEHPPRYIYWYNVVTGIPQASWQVYYMRKVQKKKEIICLKNQCGMILKVICILKCDFLEFSLKGNVITYSPFLSSLIKKAMKVTILWYLL